MALVVLGSGCSRAAPPAGQYSCSHPQPSALERHKVTHVVDGDTVHLANGDKLRLIGINAPEKGRNGAPDQPLAEEASAALVALIGPSAEVLVEDGEDPRDRHNRRLAHLFDAGANSIEAEMLRRGLAFHVAVAPNFSHLTCLRGAEGEAAAARRGVWNRAEYAPVRVSTLGQSQRGFALVRGVVTSVSFKHNGWWVQLDGELGLRIDPGSWHLFSRGDLQGLRGREVVARGWLVPMDGWWQMRLPHPAMLEVSPR